MISQQGLQVKSSVLHPSQPILGKKNQQSLLIIKCLSKPKQPFCSLKFLDKSKIIVPKTKSSLLPWKVNIAPQIFGLLTALYPDLLLTETLVSAAASVAAQVLLPALIEQYVPLQLQGPALSTLQVLLDRSSSMLTLVIDEYNGLSYNEIFEASLIYLHGKINPSAERLRVSKSEKEDHLSLTMEQYDEIVDVFEGVQLKWKPRFSTQSKIANSHSETSVASEGLEPSNYRSFELSFDKKHKDKVLCSYIPYILTKSNRLREETEVVRIHTLGYKGEGWRSTDMNHSSTFDSVAMDPGLKRELLEDLNRFVRMQEFYRRVGKPWKRGYLLHGPPGTGKSSLLRAIANYLKFDIYELNLATIKSDSELRKHLLATKNKSILAFEDIDCSSELHDRKNGKRIQAKDNQVTLSGLLSILDGLWPTFGDERIIIFTTNHKDWLEPALLRPGRMDMHVHMSYCTPSGFRLLAYNYHGVQQHQRFKEIEALLERVDASPAEVCEQLMKSEETDVALQALIEFLGAKEVEEARTDRDCT
ncbi:hypothetical protein Sjap_010295 [Stephania japonica]|uniref:AAA+ ATPase domain-containing protein n=1 Tax=Stephania japonica TaxID=461633 RepID=A0AAP0J9B7_9MAGN